MQRIDCIASACVATCLVSAAIAAPSSAATSYGMMAWGGGVTASGQLGNAAGTHTDVPVGGNGLSGVTALAGGYEGGTALLENGTVKAWGGNAYGQLGDENTSGPEEGCTCSKLPEAVSGVSSATAIAGGAWFNLALLSNGTVKAWGENQFGELGIETSEGPEHCTVSTVPCDSTPTTVAGLTGVVAIAAGAWHSLALLSNGKVMAWGKNTVGQLGNNTTTDSDVPVEVEGLSGVVAISAGYAESMALLSNGTVMAWGGNGHGQLGQEEHPATGPEVCGAAKEPCSRKPLLVKGLSEVTQVSDGYWNAIALRADGSVVTWGNNAEGQLGQGISPAEGPETCPFTSEPCSSTPAVVETLSNVKAVAASVDTSVYALLDDGTVMAFGNDDSGQLGNGEFTESAPIYSPVPVKNLVNVASVAAGAAFGMAMVPASSPPEFGRCIKVGKGVGKYENVGCTKEAASENSYEWYPGTATGHFTLSGEAATLETTPSKYKVTCLSSSGEGEYDQRNEAGEPAVPNAVAQVTLRFQHCTFLGVECHSTGAAEGEVVTHTLNGELGVEKTSTEGPAKNKIALALSPSTAGTVTEFVCSSVPAILRGSLMGPVPVNSMAVTANRNFKALSGKQKPERFEGGVPQILESSFAGNPYEQTGLTAEMSQTSEEKVEVNSVT